METNHADNPVRLELAAVRADLARLLVRRAGPPPGGMSGDILHALAGAEDLGAKEIAAKSGLLYNTEFRVLLADLIRQRPVDHLPGHSYRLHLAD
jgi:hypothetical protein